MQLVHLETGIVVLELPKGERTLRLSLPSGTYLIRRRDPDKIFAREISVTAGAPGSFQESELRPHDGGPMISKGFYDETTTSFVGKGDWRLRFGLGISHRPFFGLDQRQNDDFGNRRAEAGSLGLTYGISDRLQLAVLNPAIAYRGGREGEFEWMPKAGLLGWGIAGGSSIGTQFFGKLGAGVDGRVWLAPATTLNSELTASSALGYSTGDDFCPGEAIDCDDAERGSLYAPGSLEVAASLGLSHKFGNLLTVNVGVGLRSHVLYDRGLARRADERDIEWSLGSIQSRGFTPLPLLELHLSERFSLFGDVQILRNLRTEKTQETYLGGLIWSW